MYVCIAAGTLLIQLAYLGSPISITSIIDKHVSRRIPTRECSVQIANCKSSPPNRKNWLSLGATCRVLWRDACTKLSSSELHPSAPLRLLCWSRQNYIRCPCLFSPCMVARHATIQYEMTCTRSSKFKRDLFLINRLHNKTLNRESKQVIFGTEEITFEI